TFLDGSTTLGTVSLTTGKATLALKTLSVGSHTITAVYSGDTNFITSTTAAPPPQTENDEVSTTATREKEPSVWGQSVTFTTTVKAVAPGSGTPTGSVTYWDGSTSLGTATLSSGKATLAIKTLSVGPHTITAVYGGDANFLTSTSAALPQTVNQD